ncbi:sensor histidine kinase [Amantichitinum ursilacus]|uniref:Nitrate/nitrite sensor protein NarX n=1 Tax=Amantichitinum ursilacus TaxID=857265 RepID=A0A0N0GPZ2_9NEIS|nr:sensor histidine kinase [Amantichitinum ursilacus]KPC54254.1 Nitrate/nitrite sensor protein NarX [Amantichitinum ursilacus]
MPLSPSAFLLRVLCASATSALLACAPWAFANEADFPKVGTFDVVTQQSTVWHTRDGAPDGSPPMAQTPDGWLWFVGSGLYRFDGVHFERMTSIYGHALPSDAIHGIEAIGDTLWIGYMYGGISRFSPHGSRDYTKADGLPVGTVSHVIHTVQGQTYASTTLGLYELVNDRWLRRWPEAGAEDARALVAAADREGGIWIQSDAGITVRHPGEAHFAPLDRSLSALTTNPAGDIWLLRDHRYAARYDFAQRQVITFNRPGDPDHVDGVWLMNDGQPRVLFDGVMHLYDRNLQGGAPLHLAIYPRGPVEDDMSLFEDREKNVWIGARSGVERIRSNTLTQLSMPSQMLHNGVVLGDDGRRWVPSMNMNTVVVHADGQYQQDATLDATAGTRAPDGSVWLGSRKKIWHIQGEQRQAWDVPQECIGRNILVMTPAAGGGVWMSFIQRGLYLFKDGQWLKKGGHSEIVSPTPLSLQEDAQHRLWIGYPGNHIGMIDGTQYHEFGKADGVDFGATLSFYPSGPRLWIGGETGLVYFENGRFHHLLGSDGRTFQQVTGIVQRANGELWMMERDGLTRIAAADLARAMAGNGRVDNERFDFEQGMEGTPSMLEARPSLLQASDGLLWYATDSAVGWIDPAHIPRNGLVPPVEVTALRADQLHWQGAPGTQLPALPHNPANVQISYTALGQRIPARMHFKYRLDGVDQGWVDAGGRREAFYTNVGPGHYRFQVIAANEDGLWNKKGATLDFEVPPTLTQTRAFRVACGLLALAALYGLYLLRIRQISERVRERTEVRIAERQRIARNLHDTLLQSMQGTILRFQAIGKRVDPQLSAEFEAALDQADAAVSEGRDQVMDLREASAIPDDLVQALNRMGSALGHTHDIDFALHVAGHSRRSLQAPLRAEAYAIAREAVLNALKHAQAQHLEVELVFGDRQFVLHVRDDGIGMPDELIENGRPGHFGLAGMRERARQLDAHLTVWSRAGEGTEIELSVPARMAYAEGRGPWWRLWQRGLP